MPLAFSPGAIKRQVCNKKIKANFTCDPPHTPPSSLAFPTSRFLPRSKQRLGWNLMLTFFINLKLFHFKQRDRQTDRSLRGFSLVSFLVELVPKGFVGFPGFSTPQHILMGSFIYDLYLVLRLFFWIFFFHFAFNRSSI